MHKRNLQPVNVLLNTLFQGLGISDKIILASLRRKWRSIFSEPLSMHTSPVELKGSKLVISVDSPAWLQHLKFLQKEIVEKMTAHGITQVQFRLGKIRLDKEHKVSDKMAPPEAFIELTEEEICRIAQIADDIEDSDLREVVRQTMEKAARRKLQ